MILIRGYATIRLSIVEALICVGNDEQEDVIENNLSSMSTHIK